MVVDHGEYPERWKQHELLAKKGLKEEWEEVPYEIAFEVKMVWEGEGYETTKENFSTEGHQSEISVLRRAIALLKRT